MSYCLNPACQKSDNSPKAEFCQNCQSKLLLDYRYRALKALGQGSFGRTFLAVDEGQPLKPLCVIKRFLPPNQNISNVEKAAELFRQEALRLQKLGKHPFIPSLLTYVEQDNCQYLVQEFVDGLNLAQQLEQDGSFTEIQIRQLLNDLLPILQFVHNHQVIHRDIKPENIIRRADGQLVLVDFGAAKLLAKDTIAKTGTLIGTVLYAAPEQIMGKAVFASDFYSLGVTCIHLLTQVSPIDIRTYATGISNGARSAPSA
jgi:serine/threonine protein kinase